MPAAVLPPARSPLMERRSAARAVGNAAYFAVVLLWAAFLLALALSPETLDSIWQWFRHLDRPYQVVGWIVMLPYTAALAVWESGWMPAVRVAVVGLLALGTILGCAPRPRET